MMEDEKRGGGTASEDARVPVVLKCLLVFENTRSLLSGQRLGGFKRNGVATRQEG